MKKELDMEDVFNIIRQHIKNEKKEITDILSIFENISPHVLLSKGHETEILSRIDKTNQEKIVSVVFSLSSKIGLIYDLNELTNHVVKTVSFINNNIGLPESYTKRLSLNEKTPLLLIIILLRKLAKNS